MRILFTAVGNSDPVRGYHDAAMLHIIRHCNPYKIYMLLTEKQKIKEENESLYSKAINYLAKKLRRKEFKIIEQEIIVNEADNSFKIIKQEINVNEEDILDKLANEPDSPTLILLKINVNEADNLDKLDIIRKIFINAFNDPDNEGAEWLFNITSGTPQIDVVMSLLALDYSSQAIQVRNHDPEHNYPPCNSWEQAQEQLDENEDDNAEPRINKPRLQPFNEYRLKNQIISLVKKFEYYGAHKLVDNDKNKSLFIGTNIEPLLKYAYLRKNLQSDEANQELDRIKLYGKIIDSEKKEQLRIGTKVEARFYEFFQVMELCQRNQQLSEFVLKLSPILLDLGIYYLKNNLRKIINFRLENISQKKNDSKYKLLTDNILSDPQYSKMSSFFNIYNSEGELYGLYKEDNPKLRNGDELSFDLIVDICNYYKENELQNDVKHKKICEAFEFLKTVEKNARNRVAHELASVTDEKLKEGEPAIVDSDPSNSDFVKLIIDSEQILSKLHEVIKLIRGNYKDIACSYDELNALIEGSFQ